MPRLVFLAALLVALAPVPPAGDVPALTVTALDVGQGSVYPALVRLENRGWVTNDWGTTENNRRARYYRLTTLGEKQLRKETENWRKYARAVELILSTS